MKNESRSFSILFSIGWARERPPVGSVVCRQLRLEREELHQKVYDGQQTGDNTEVQGLKLPAGGLHVLRKMCISDKNSHNQTWFYIHILLFFEKII